MSKKTYYRELDTLKGVAIFCVLLCHSIILYPINLLENGFWKEVFKFFGSVPMPLFFMVSGYCFSYKGNYKEFIVKKAYRLLLPYVFFGMVDVVPRQVLSAFVNRPSSVADSLKSMFLYGGQYWFLYTLFILFVIYPVIYVWQKNSMIKKIIVEMLLLVLALVETDVKIFCFDSIIYYLFYFNTGAMLKCMDIDVFQIDKLKRAIRIAVIGLLFVLWIGLSIFLPYTTITRLLMGIVGIIVFFLFTKYQWFNFVFARLGKYTLQLYLLNGFLLVISRTIICSMTQSPIIIVSFNMLVTLVCSYLFIKYFCERFKLIKVFMGMS